MRPADRPLRAIALPAGPAFVAALGRARADGDAVLPLPSDGPDAARRLLLDLLLPTALVDARGVHPRRDGRGVARDVAVVIATSGSTGAPKGVELTDAALAASADATATRLGLTGDDTWLACLPPDHIAGLQVLLRAARLGAEAIVPPTADPAEVAAVLRAGARPVVSLVPTQLRRLLAADAAVEAFRVILLGGAHPPADLVAQARSRGATVVTTYGMTETCGGCVYDGRPLDGVEVDVADGRVRLRGATRFARYRRDAEATRAALDADGWFATGDLGAWRDGRLEVSGRADEVIISGGRNVVPVPVAARLAAHPDLAEAEVAGHPDPEWGQVVVAVVVPRPGAAVPPLGALRDWVAQALPRADAPRRVVVTDALPRLRGGKVDRLALDRLVAHAPAGPTP